METGTAYVCEWCGNDCAELFAADDSDPSVGYQSSLNVCAACMNSNHLIDEEYAGADIDDGGVEDMEKQNDETARREETRLFWLDRSEHVDDFVSERCAI